MADNLTREQSEFNMAVSFLNRINTSFYIINQSRRDLDINAWFNELMILSDELSDDMKNDEPDKAKIFKDYLHPKVQNLNNINTEQLEVPKELYDKLCDFERFLRKIHKDAGYKTKFKEDLFEPEDEW